MEHRRGAVEALAPLGAELEARYAELRSRALKLDMTRGKPSPEQLELSDALLDRPRRGFGALDGTDGRNYGGLDGLPEMKELFSPILDAPPEQILIGGNSSLQMMHDALVRALLHGVPDGAGPWGRLPRIRFLCPVPGYDRHFAICQHFGIEMLPIALGAEGPDMDQVQELVLSDASIVGMWCVPKYSNPTGVTYSDRVVELLARMPTAAPDFRLFWDNAYAVHDLYPEGERLADIISACRRAGHENRPLAFASTSKITFAGAGVAALASSPANIADARRHLSIQTIGPDKINQLRHIDLFGDFAGIRRHMLRHAELLRPKFEAVTAIFERELGGKYPGSSVAGSSVAGSSVAGSSVAGSSAAGSSVAGSSVAGSSAAGSSIASWTTPRGGYFISLDTLDGCASQVVALAAAAGVKLTAAGATFPGGHDPRDRNIRIAPTLPALDQIRTAMEVVSVCVALASLRTAGGVARA